MFAPEHVTGALWGPVATAVRAARIAADGEGGQILLSESTRAIVGDDLPEGAAVRELGERTLKDIDRPEPLYELVYGAAEIAPARRGDDRLARSDIQSWVGIASEAIRKGKGFDPGPMIEQRVLRQIEESMRQVEAHSAPKPARKAKKSESVADEIDRLRALRDSGALSDDQYQRAVDRVVSEG